MWESIKKFFGFGKKSEPAIIEFKTQQAEKDIVVSPAVAEAMKANREVYRHTPSPRVIVPAPKPAVTFSQAPTERKAVSSGSTTPYRRDDEVDNTASNLVTAYAMASIMSSPSPAPSYSSSSSRYDSDCSSSSYSSSSSDSSSSCDSGSSSSGDW